MSRRGFARLERDELQEVSASGGKATWALGKAHSFTRREARDASFKRRSMTDREPLRMRKRDGRYEYRVELDGRVRWLSRQMVYLLRKKGRIA